MAVIYPPRWYLDPASLTPGEEVGVLLQYTDNNSPVLPVEVILQDIPCVGGTQADGEGVEALICRHLPL